ncbi:MAG: DUF2339 domain-containing protein [Lysobacterales bacterium]
MQILLIIVGAIVGSMFADMGRQAMGLGLGAMAGYLLARQRRMQRQIDEQAGQSTPAAPKVEATSRPPTARQSAGLADDTGRGDSQPVPAPEEDRGFAADVDQWDKAQAKPSDDWASLDNGSSVKVPEPLMNAVAAAKNWLTSGNVPVKIGVIVSFFGVAFLLKYAVDQQLVSLPIEFRYMAVAAGAIAMLTVGWRLRSRLSSYALSLQGGGIGILFLTIFSAFRLHPLLPAPMAFGLLIVLTVAAGVLAVAQNASSLAILGIAGGFLAPVLTSSGSGNHVGLFSYYLLLNTAVLGIAWYRSWRFLNVIGFVFTFGVGAVWGARDYEPALLASTLPFLIVFFVFYQAIAVLFAFRQPPRLKGLVDGTLVFGTPVIAFAMQAKLVEHTEYGLAISALCAAIFFILVALALGRVQSSRPDQPFRLLIESYVAMAVAFATIAIPLALDGSWTAVAWALEGAALVWIGVRQSGFLPRASGVLLILGSGVAFLEQGWRAGTGMAVLNAHFLGSLLIATAALFASCYLARDRKPLPLQWLASAIMLVWGLLWWIGAGGLEIAYRADEALWGHLFTTYCALSAVALAALARRFDWRFARWATLGYLPLVSLVAFAYLLDGRNFLSGIGLLAWPIAGIAHLAVMRFFEPGRAAVVTLWHTAGYLVFTAIGFVAVANPIHDAGFNSTWAIFAASAVPIALCLATLSLRKRILWPLDLHWSAYLTGTITAVAGVLFITATTGLETGGSPAPLPYIPLLNPLDLLTGIGLVMALKLILLFNRRFDHHPSWNPQWALIVWSIAAFILTTLAVVRGVHHVFQVPWSDGALGRSVYVQSALSIYWAMLGFGAMWWGAKKLQRSIWLTGTALMAMVVAKLFLVDLGNTATIARIVSFLGVGVLLLVVGYLAPAPPKSAPTEVDPSDDPEDDPEDAPEDAPEDDPAGDDEHTPHQPPENTHEEK